MPKHVRNRCAIKLVEGSRLVEIVGHGKRGALKVAGILVQIGFGNSGERGIDDHLRPDLEPAVEADVSVIGRNDRHEDAEMCRDDRNTW